MIPEDIVTQALVIIRLNCKADDWAANLLYEMSEMSEPGIGWFIAFCSYILKDRFLPIEPYIIKSPRAAYLYAVDVLKGRWPEAEPCIRTHPVCFEYYKKALDIKD